MADLEGASEPIEHSRLAFPSGLARHHRQGQQQQDGRRVVVPEALTDDARAPCCTPYEICARCGAPLTVPGEAGAAGGAEQTTTLSMQGLETTEEHPAGEEADVGVESLPVHLGA